MIDWLLLKVKWAFYFQLYHGKNIQATSWRDDDDDIRFILDKWNIGISEWNKTSISHNQIKTNTSPWHHTINIVIIEYIIECQTMKKNFFNVLFRETKV